MGTQLEKAKYIQGYLRERLKPLSTGKPVVIKVEGTKLSYKRRVGKNPLLFLTPSSVYGSNARFIVVSLQGFGCEVIDLDNLSPLQLTLMGLPWQLSKTLSSELNYLFNIQEV